MISVSQAEAIINQHLFHPGVVRVKLEESVGKILAEPVFGDRDFPPFHRVAMDGIAIQHESFLTGNRKFRIESVQAAGASALALKDAKNCIEIMTGASLPEKTDTVVRYEDLKIENGIATIIADQISSGQHIHRQASDSKKGETLLENGRLISPAEVALLASVGKSVVSINSSPSIIIISTGDELVDIESKPLPHQIRTSNSYALQSAFKRIGYKADISQLQDDKNLLEKEIPIILNKYDLVILSGGVSKGKYDYIPEVLEKADVKQLLHQVAQRPGKPLWFGQSERNTVFALPGNPVSSFMCFYRYIKLWLSLSQGKAEAPSFAILEKDFQFLPPLTYFLQVNTRNDYGKLVAKPAQGGGSGDFVNLKEVNGFLELPAEQNDFKAGSVFRYFPFRD